jgi:hypothetical protein
MACSSSQPSSGGNPDGSLGGSDGSAGGSDAPSSGTDAPAASDAGGAGPEASTDGSSAANGCPLGPTLPPEAGGGCNLLTPGSALVQEMCSDAAVPVANGGTIQDGTYLLQSVTYYGACPPPGQVTQDRVTWVICGNQWQSAQLIGDASTNYNEMVSPGDAGPASLTLGESCPGPRSFGWKYDVTPGHIAFTFPSFANSIEVDTYGKQ